MAKPTSKTLWSNISPDNRQEPDINRKNIGFLAEKPAYQYFNWLIWNHGQWIDFFENALKIGVNSIIGETGNLGIGTDNPLAKVHINDNLLNSSCAGFRIDSSPDVGLSAVELYHHHAPVGDRYAIRIGHHSDTSRQMVMTTNGIVGIGTASPDTKLHIAQNGADIIKLQNIASNGGIWQFKIGGGGFWDGHFIVANRQSGQDNHSFVITPNNNVAFYNEYDGLFYYDINNLATGNNVGVNLRFVTKNTTNDYNTSVDISKWRASGEFSIRNNDPSGFFSLHNAGAERIRIANNGNIGIGTDNPFSGRLHINKNNTSGLGGDLWLTNMEGGSIGNKAAISFGIDGTIDPVPNARITAELIDNFKANFIFSNFDGLGCNEKMRLTHDGKVGIGTNAPATTLDVNGVIRGSVLSIDGTAWDTKGTIGSDGNWGMLFRAKIAGSIADFGFISHDGSILAKIISGRIKDKRGYVTPVGTIVPFAGSVCPEGWFFCWGATVGRNDYADLFAVIGVNFGSGDGANTFHLPDFRGRFLRGVDCGTGRDPDRWMRYAMNPGGSGGGDWGIGSCQDDMYQLHGHQPVGQSIQNTFGGPDFAYCVNGGYQNLPNTYNSGGNETRPKNAYVQFIIKY